MSEDKRYSKGEERLNVISHAVGFACALAVSVFFVGEVVDKGGDAWALASMLLYAVGMLSSYVFSTAYHATRVGTPARRLLRKLDHSAIYWYIAGCYSPVTLIAMRDVGNWGWGIFAFCWLCLWFHKDWHFENASKIYLLVSVMRFGSFGGSLKSWLKAQHSENEDHGIWSHHFMGNRWGNSGNSVRLYFFGLQNHCRC